MEQLKRLRTEKGLSQARLAARAEVDPSTVNQIERGAREASPATLRKLAHALDVSLFELLEDDSPKAEPSLFEAGEQRRRVKEAKEEILAEEGPFYSAHDVTGILLAHKWRQELEEFKEKPGVQIGTLKAVEYLSLIQFTRDLFGVVAVYENATAEADHPRHPGYMAALQEMKDVRQETADTLRPILHRLEDRKDTNAEFRKILEGSNLEDLLSKAENR